MIRGVVNHFNRGVVDDEALARDDLKRVNNSASEMVNFIPMRLGPMIYRPGLEFIHRYTYTKPHYIIPFVSSIDSIAIIDFSNNEVSFFVNDEIVKSIAVSSYIQNRYFTSNTVGWTDDSAGASSTSWYLNTLSLEGDGNSSAVSYQTITNTQVGIEHTLKVIVKYAKLTIKIGTTGKGSYDIFKGELRVGEHFLSFTPQSNITITFENSKIYRASVDSAEFVLAGNIIIKTDVEDQFLKTIRYKQSIDVVYMAFGNGQQFQVERRGDKSWSVVPYYSDNGPFGFINNTNISLSPSALSGNTIVTSSEEYFTSSDIGRLLKLSSQGQTYTSTVSVDTGAGTNSIRVTGVSSGATVTPFVFSNGTFLPGSSSSSVPTVVNVGRSFNISAEIPSGSVTLQRSVNDSLWEDLEVYTTNISKVYDDGLDNSIIYYRLFVKAGDNANADNIVLGLNFKGGSVDGICRVTNYVSETVVDVQVLNPFGEIAPTKDWYAGVWKEGKYPSAVDIYEGRLWYSGDDKAWGSESDSYYSFNSDIEGNSQAIQKTIGFGSVDPVEWLKATNKLVLGTSLDEISIRSSNFGEALTQANANIRGGSNQGSANNDPIVIDNVIYFVQRSGIKLFSLQSYMDTDTVNTNDVNLLNKEITSSGIKRIAFTRQPETRIFCVLDNGKMAIHTVDVAEEVSAWSLFETDGLIEDVIVLPQKKEDRVYLIINRNSVLSLEKMSLFDGGQFSSLDSHISFDNTTTNITGLDHLNGKEVYINGDGKLTGPYTVAGGSITAPQGYTKAYVGIAYEANYKSNKLSGYKQGTVLTDRKRVVDTGLCLLDYYHDSIKIGATVDTLRPLPSLEDGKAPDPTGFISDYNELPFMHDGKTESDPRIHIRATAPCTILALTYGIEDFKDPTSKEK